MKLQARKLKISKLDTTPKTIYVGFSGGADSTALLLLLHEVYPDQLVAIHFNHGMRPESFDEEFWCLHFCLDRNIRFDAFQLNLPSTASEQEARMARLTVWKQLARKGGVVALGHHQDDVNENFFLRLMRGSGITGLTGLRSHKVIDGVQFWRPLLHLHKQDLLNFLQENGVIDWCEDGSNAKNIYRRNKVRNELIPLYRSISTELNGLETSISVLQQEAEFIEELAMQEFKKLKEVNSLTQWMKVPKVLLARILRQLVKDKFQEDVIPSPATVDRIYHSIHSAEITQILVPLSGRFQFVVNKKGLTVVDSTLPTLAVPGDMFWNPILEKEIKFGDFTVTKSEQGIAFDLYKLELPLRITTFKPGDRMKVSAGLTKKVKKIFNEQKVDASLRRTIPVVWSGDQIIWIPSLARSKSTLPQVGTTQIIKLSMN